MHSNPDVFHSQLTCRSCRHATEPFLSFGELPLANGLVSPEAPVEQEERFPLTLTLCTACGLVQLAETVDPAKLFRHYVYLSSNSAAFLAHAQTLTRRMIVERRLDRGSRVVEIASNDGYLLQFYRDAGVPVLGIEPAINIAEVARRRGIETVCGFFSADLADELCRDGRADVVHAHNVMAHVPDLNGFIAGIGKLLAPGGAAVIEAPYLRDMVDQREFDTVYHEHLCYFSLTPLAALFARHGLQIDRVERIAVHGGSLRLFVGHARAGSCDPSVEQMLEDERGWGVADLRTYRQFADAVQSLRPAIRDFLARLRKAGHSIAAYGAAAKGATLLNYCGIGTETIGFVVDRSPLKQGFAMPGVRVPILSTDELLKQQPDFVLLLAWNFADEILEQQAEYQQRGGRFIVPVPNPRVLMPGRNMSRPES
jgi:SAM-dependent methyltransferase